VEGVEGALSHCGGVDRGTSKEFGGEKKRLFQVKRGGRVLLRGRKGSGFN